MSKQVQVHGFTGTGPTSKAAKLDAVTKIEALQKGYWNPVVRTWKGATVIVFRTLLGWEYTFLNDRDSEIQSREYLSIQGAIENKALVLLNAESHLVQKTWELGEPIDVFPDWFSGADRRRDAISYRKWQLRYRYLIRTGVKSDEAHRTANDPMSPELELAFSLGLFC